MIKLEVALNVLPSRLKPTILRRLKLLLKIQAPFPGKNTQAPALYSYGNQHFFQNCNFLSYQDTLLSYHGTHYFKNCYIRGVTDFIWGAGRAVFDGCSLHIPQNGKKMAYITANVILSINI